MSNQLRMLLGVAVILYFLLILHFVKKKMLTLKYILIWIFSGVAMAILVIFPSLLTLFVQAVGIESPMNGLFVFGIFFILIISMSLTAIVSKQTERIKNLAQSNAILEKRVRELENFRQLDEMEEGQNMLDC